MLLGWQGTVKRSLLTFFTFTYPQDNCAIGIEELLHFHAFGFGKMRIQLAEQYGIVDGVWHPRDGSGWNLQIKDGRMLDGFSRTFQESIHTMQTLGAGKISIYFVSDVDNYASPLRETLRSKWNRPSFLNTLSLLL